MSLIASLRKRLGADFHPANLLADVVSDTSQDIKLRVDCAKTLLPYVESTLKSVEIRGSIDHNVGLLRVTMFGEDDPYTDAEFEEVPQIEE